MKLLRELVILSNINNVISDTVYSNWTTWTSWGECSQTNPGEYGSHSRTRECAADVVVSGSPVPCEGLFYANFNQEEPCTMYSNWTEWNPWGECSQANPGEYGSHSRTRECAADVVVSGSPVPCEGLSYANFNQAEPCTMYSNWAQWTTWGECSQANPGEYGSQSRTRECAANVIVSGIPVPCEGLFFANFNQAEPCTMYSNWADWTTWGECSGGTHSRTRECAADVVVSGSPVPCEGLFYANFNQEESCTDPAADFQNMLAQATLHMNSILGIETYYLRWRINLRKKLTKIMNSSIQDFQDRVDNHGCDPDMMMVEMETEEDDMDRSLPPHCKENAKPIRLLGRSAREWINCYNGPKCGNGPNREAFRNRQWAKLRKIRQRAYTKLGC